MNKEEEVIIKILEKYKYDCDGTELKNIVQEALISFMDYTKGQDLDEINRFYRIYALMYWAIKDLQSKLDIANKKIEKTKTKAKLICDIGFDYDGYENSKDLKKIIDELVKYASDILSIIGGNNE